MRESWAFINCHSFSRKRVLRNLHRSCAASSQKRWKFSRTDARLEAFSLVDTWRKDTGIFRRTFPCEEWNKGRDGPRPSSWSQWCMVSFGTGTKRSEQRPRRVMSRLTDKIRSNGNPFATPSSSLLRFRSFGDSSHQFSAFSFRLQFPQILSVSLRVCDSRYSLRPYKAQCSRVIVTWHFERNEKLLQSLMDWSKIHSAVLKDLRMKD